MSARMIKNGSHDGIPRCIRKGGLGGNGGKPVRKIGIIQLKIHCRKPYSQASIRLIVVFVIASAIMTMQAFKTYIG